MEPNQDQTTESFFLSGVLFLSIVSIIFITFQNESLQMRVILVSMAISRTTSNCISFSVMVLCIVSLRLWNIMEAF